MQVVHAMFTNLSTVYRIGIQLQAMYRGLVNPSIKVLSLPA